jgi:hypothetical protein
MAKFFLDFTQKESCGKCTFCRIGTKRMLEILTRITEGNGKETDLDTLEKLSKCLMADSDSNIRMADSKEGGIQFQIWDRCGNDASGNPIPYAQCLKVSNLPSSLSSGTIGHPTVLDYVGQNLSVYCKTNPNHYVGYSIFALENTGTAPQGAFGGGPAIIDDSGNCTQGCNIAVQEPWYIGYESPTFYDPYVSTSNSDNIWKNLGAILNNISACNNPVTPPAPPKVCAVSVFPKACDKGGKNPGNGTNTMSINIDSAAYPDGVCLGYCSNNIVYAVKSSAQNSIQVDKGTMIYIDSPSNQCYDNNGKNGENGNYVSDITTGIFVTQQYNAPKCLLRF